MGRYFYKIKWYFKSVIRTIDWLTNSANSENNEDDLMLCFIYKLISDSSYI